MIITQFTNGFGNNIFQYVAARLLAEFHNQEVFAIPPYPDYYAIPCLKKLGVSFTQEIPFNISIINERHYKSYFDVKHKNHDFLLNGYFEDYTFYKEHINKIKDWLPKVKRRSNDDLVIHFRAGDRLLYKNEFDSNSKPKVENYIKAIEQFDFTNLHIVTDMVEWDILTKEKLENMKFHTPTPSNLCVSVQKAVDYFNSIVEGLSIYKPIVEKRSIYEDFNFIRSFNNILFQHGTLGWWAAATSEARKVGVYGPWRPWKKESNTNLSNVGFEGWFKWE